MFDMKKRHSLNHYFAVVCSKKKSISLMAYETGGNLVLHTLLK